MKAQKSIALVAHDNRKKDLVEWVEWNVNILLSHKLTCTGTTGSLVEKTIQDKLTTMNIPHDFTIQKLHSGADFMISSPLMEQEYVPIIKDYKEYLQRDIQGTSDPE